MDEVVINHKNFVEFASAALKLIQEDQPSQLDRLFHNSRSALQAYRNAANATDVNVAKEGEEAAIRRLQGIKRLAIDARDALLVLLAEADRLRVSPNESPKSARVAILDDLEQSAIGCDDDGAFEVSPAIRSAGFESTFRSSRRDLQDLRR